MEIVKVTLESPYGRYFLTPYDIFTEAPGSSGAATVNASPKNDPLSASPPEMGGGDDGGGGDPLSSAPPDMDTSGADAAAGPNTDASDAGGDDGGDPLSASPPGMDTGDDIAGGNDASGGAADGPNTDSSTGDDAGGDGPNTDDSSMDDADGPNADDSGLGDEGGEGGDGDDAAGGEGGDSGGDSSGNDNKNGVDYSNTRMWLLSKEFINVHKAVSVYLEKLSGIIIDNEEAGSIVKQCVDSLTEIKDIIFDYMTIKFSLTSYVQNLLFYEKIVTSIKLNFKLLREAFEISERAKEEDNKNSKSHSSKRSEKSDNKDEDRTSSKKDESKKDTKKDTGRKIKHTIKRSKK